MKHPDFIIGLDTETTGLKVNDGDRIIELCMVVVRLSDRKPIIRLVERYTNQGRKINDRAQKVHGISDADLIGKPRFADSAAKIYKILTSNGMPLAHNADFDMEFLAHHLKECGYDITHLIYEDSMSEGMTFSYDNKPPSLREFCWAMGVDYDPDNAHAADYDVDVMLEAYFKALDRGHFELPLLPQTKAA